MTILVNIELKHMIIGYTIIVTLGLIRKAIIPCLISSNTFDNVNSGDSRNCCLFVFVFVFVLALVD